MKSRPPDKRILVKEAVVNRQMWRDFTVHCLLDVVNCTHQDEFSELAVSGSRTLGAAERALDCREDGFTQRSLT